MRHQASLSRRGFMKTLAAAGAVVGFPMVIPSRVMGADGAVAPSNRVTIGCIGMGGMGMGNMSSFLGQPDAQVVAVCDVDSGHLGRATDSVNKRYSNAGCAAMKDFRDLVARDDIDAISLATPDHWHAIPVIMAAKNGKDIYGEKPFSHDLREGRAMIEALTQYGRVWQTGSWQRSGGSFRRACELVRNGRIGKVHTVEVGLPTGGQGGAEEFIDPPAHLDYDFWIGPAPWAPYSRNRTHWDWRWQLDYGGGQMMDWIGHHGDIAQWGLDTEYTGPVEIEPNLCVLPTRGLYTAPMRYKYTCTFKNGVKMIVANSGTDGIRMGAKWIGDKGWVWVDRGGFDTEPKSLRQEEIGPDEIQLYRSAGHHRNFLDCVKSRKLTITPAEVAHRSASVGHLGQVAMLLGRTIRWNPDTEQVIGDAVANGMLGKARREPWNL
jgi:predicted dehydrogenase